MRILADLRDLVLNPHVPAISEVQKTPDGGEAGRTAINGRFAIPVLRGAEFPVDESSYVQPVDGSDVSSIAWAHILSAYPMYTNAIFCPLLTPADLLDLDLTAQFKNMVGVNPDDPPVYYPTRAQVGREPGGGEGLAPMMVAILPLNEAVTPFRPGVLITREFDLPANPMTPWVLQEADNFLIYWKIYGFDVTHDLAADSGGAPGNEPSVRYLKEIEQEGFGERFGNGVFFSPDNGANWYEVGLLEPLHLCKPTSKFRLAFLNGRSDSAPDGTMGKVYLATFGVLF